MRCVHELGGHTIVIQFPPMNVGLFSWLFPLLMCGFGRVLWAQVRWRKLENSGSLTLPSLQKKLPLMALSTAMAESFKELDPESSMG